jgi:hypothetical protein
MVRSRVVVPGAYLLLSGLVLSLLVSSGCNGCGSKDVGTTQSAEEIAPGPAPTAEVPPLPSPGRLASLDSNVRVYVDLSGSMQGYQRSSGGPLHGMLAACKEEMYAEGLFEIQAAGFADTVDAFCGVSGLISVLDWKANRGRTCLAAPWAKERRLADRHQDQAMTVVVTDGVASATNGSCGSNCASGGDVTCVAEAMRDYIKCGNGLWVVGIKVPFRGAYYPEQGTAGRLDIAEQVQRPIYLWIGTSNVATGRAVASRLAQRMRAKNTPVMAWEVWPGSWTGWTPHRSSADWTAGDFVSTSVEAAPCGDGPVLQFMTVTDSGECPRVSVLSENNDWRAGARWPFQLAVRHAVSAPDAPLGSLIAMTAEWPPVVDGGYVQASRDTSSALYAGCLVTNKRRVEVREKWTGTMDVAALRAWSTEDDAAPGNIGRTLNLENLWGLTTKRLIDEANAGMWTALVTVEIDPSANQ